MFHSLLTIVTETPEAKESVGSSVLDDISAKIAFLQWENIQYVLIGILLLATFIFIKNITRSARHKRWTKMNATVLGGSMHSKTKYKLSVQADSNGIKGTIITNYPIAQGERVPIIRHGTTRDIAADPLWWAAPKTSIIKEIGRFVWNLIWMTALSAFIVFIVISVVILNIIL